MDLYYTDPAQHPITAGEDLDDLSDLSGSGRDRFLAHTLCTPEEFGRSVRAASPHIGLVGSPSDHLDRNFGGQIAS